MQTKQGFGVGYLTKSRLCWICILVSDFSSENLGEYVPCFAMNTEKRLYFCVDINQSPRD